ncbi:MAG: response regulator transcription factor [Anaerolineae bacterium]|nr:response regulator transcription factor [Anaerolineae bacterium]
MAIKIVLADDSDLMMVGTEAIIESELKYQVVGKAHTLNDVLQSIQQQIPEIAILSECLYDTDILSAVDAVRHASPKIFMIVVGMITDGTLIHNLYMHGIKGYLYRGDPLQECLLPAIRTVLQDRPYLSPTANAEYLITLQSRHPVPKLNAEARIVLKYLAQGVSINQIACHMGTSPRRIYAIRDRLRRRFGVETNEHLISRAVAEGFIVLSTL